MNAKNKNKTIRNITFVQWTNQEFRNKIVIQIEKLIFKSKLKNWDVNKLFLSNYLSEHYILLERFTRSTVNAIYVWFRLVDSSRAYLF